MQMYSNLFKLLEEDFLSILLLSHLVFETKSLGWIENTRINLGVLNLSCTNRLIKIFLHLVTVISQFQSPFLKLGVTLKCKI